MIADLISKALVQAKLDDATHGEIDIAMYEIAFFETPHQGRNLVTLSDIACAIVRGVLQNSKNSFMNVLKANSLLAQSHLDSFR